jgi:UDP-N-acetylmuramate dehydrogenase
LGNAGISTNHSLALVNLGGASAAEIVKLKELVQARVEEKFGIRLEPEPILVGF